VGGREGLVKRTLFDRGWTEEWTRWVRGGGIALCMAICLTACGTPRPSIIQESHAVPPLVMKLLPGDEIEISFFGAPDLNTTQAIRRDGRVSLRLIGDVVAAGKTTEQLQAELRNRYANQLQIKDVSVILRVPPPVLVSGAVQKPGRVLLSRPLTVLDAIMESGGFNLKEAEVRSVVLIRHESGKRIGMIFDFKAALAGEGEYRPFYVQPFDIVYVPRTRIARINQWIDQHINKMLPDLGIGYDSSGEVTVYR
jgi:polysaccharide export outer membrane protein